MQKKEYILDEEEEASGEGALELGAAGGALGLFLLPAGRPRRRFTRADDDATAAAEILLFLLPRGWPRPRFPHRGTEIQARSICIGHENKWQGRKNLDGLRRKKTMRRRKALVKGLGFLPWSSVLYL
jgi:hypothetical protein